LRGSDVCLPLGDTDNFRGIFLYYIRRLNFDNNFLYDNIHLFPIPLLVHKEKFEAAFLIYFILKKWS
jgi:hypothetical protein